MAVVAGYLSAPTGVIEFEFDTSPELEDDWRSMKQLETVVGEKCRRENCSNDRVRFSVNCLTHHFEVIMGQLPPESCDE